MAIINPIRGMHDLLPEQAARHHAIITSARHLAKLYGFEEISTPILESIEVFSRPLGESSDVVGKEMYVFTDRGGDTVAMRPEGTAPVVRAILSNKLTHLLPLKYFYAGPMFRYERPQKGRLRQFHQLGVEHLGDTNPWADAEGIALAAEVLAAVGLGQDVVRLEVNTLGDRESRQAHRSALVTYFENAREKLSEVSRVRLEKNPLRILDSKEPEDQELIEKAPRLEDYLNDTSRAFYAQLTEGLDALGVTYVRSPRLVRGFDYYSHTVFEFVTEQLGAQGTVLGGGRYDPLMEMLGGPPTPGFGWAAGIERLEMLAKLDIEQPLKVALLPMGDSANVPVHQLGQRLRHEGLHIEVVRGSNIGKQMKRADKIGAHVAVIVGEDELKRGTSSVRKLADGSQQEISLEKLSEHLKSLSATPKV